MAVNEPYNRQFATPEQLDAFAQLNSAAMRSTRPWVPTADRGRLYRYSRLTAITHGYYDTFAEQTGELSLSYDKDSGQDYLRFVSYGEARKFSQTIVKFLLGDSLHLETDVPDFDKYWKDNSVNLTIELAESWGGSLGDIVYHVRRDEGTEKVITTYQDPSSFFIFREENGKPTHTGLVFEPDQPPEDVPGFDDDWIYVLEYKFFGKNVLYHEAYYISDEPNTEKYELSGLVLKLDLTEGILETDEKDKTWGRVGTESLPLTYMPLVHVPFTPIGGEVWGACAIHYVIDAVLAVMAANGDLLESARRAAIPIFCRTDGGPVVVKNVDGDEEAIDLRPGTAMRGDWKLIDNSSSLDSAIKHRNEVVNSIYEALGIPLMLSDSSETSAESGSALNVLMYNIITEIENIRKLRNDQYKELFYPIMQFLGFRNPEEKDSRLAWGIPLGREQILREAITMLVAMEVLTPNEARKWILSEGLIPVDILESIEIKETDDEDDEDTDDPPNEGGSKNRNEAERTRQGAKGGGGTGT